MTRRLTLLAAVLAALTAAVAGGLLARPPMNPAPAYALGSTLVWHVEIAVLLFVVLYGAIVTVHLAFDGATFTHIGARGIDIPQLRVLDENGEDVQQGIGVLTRSLDDANTAVTRLEHRMDALENAHYLLLRPTGEDA